MRKRISGILLTCLLLLATPCWGIVFDYSVAGTFLDDNQVSGSISGNVWIDDASYAPSLDNLTLMGNFTYSIPYFNLIFESTSMDFAKTGTESRLRIQFWTEPNPNAGYRNFNDSFYLVSTSGDFYGTANVLTNTGNFITDFATIPTQFFFPDDGYGVLSGPDPGIAHMSINLTQVSPVPEPTTMLLLSSGIVGLIACRKRFIR